MPRSTQSKEASIIGYFTSTDLPIAQIVYKLAGDALKARLAKSTEARERALAAQKKADKVSALSAPAAAAPKAKKRKARKARKPRAAAPVAEVETFDLPGTAQG